MTPCLRIFSRVPVWAPAGAASGIAKPSASVTKSSFLPIMISSTKEGSTRPVHADLCGRCYRTQQQPVFQGLAKVGCRAGGETMRAGFGLVVGGDHDRRQTNARLLELLQHVQPGHAGHVQVEDEAVGAPLREGIQELGPGGKGLGFQVRGAHQALERLADRLLVVDDGDKRSGTGLGHVEAIEPVRPPTRNWTMVLWTKVLRPRAGPRQG